MRCLCSSLHITGLGKPGQSSLIGNRSFISSPARSAASPSPRSRLPCSASSGSYEFKSLTIVNHCLFKCERSHCLFSSLPGIACTSSAVTTMRKVESQFGKLVCAFHALLIVSRLKNLANHLVKTPASRRYLLLHTGTPGFSRD